jgi:hypothetical protein
LEAIRLESLKAGMLGSLEALELSSFPASQLPSFPAVLDYKLSANSYELNLPSDNLYFNITTYQLVYISI